MKTHAGATEDQYFADRTAHLDDHKAAGTIADAAAQKNASWNEQL